MFQNDIEGIQELKLKYHLLKEEVGKVIVGQNKTVELVLLSILCDSHSLLVGVPGLAKTLLVKTIAQALDLKYKRIQFTPDLLPSDLIGSNVYNPSKNEFYIKK